MDIPCILAAPRRRSGVACRADTSYTFLMDSHQQIDRRSLVMAQAIASRIDADPEQRALAAARARCARWRQTAPCADLAVWVELLSRPWPEIRAVLLDPTERGTRLRQSNPFCGVLSPRERWTLYREFRHDAHAA